MARYLEIAEEGRKEVVALINDLTAANPGIDAKDLAIKIGRIVNLAVRCAPRAVQSTVRKNIVHGMVRDYCHVTMTEVTDERTGNTYHAINISRR
jgi:hypothetical protein